MKNNLSYFALGALFAIFITRVFYSEPVNVMLLDTAVAARATSSEMNTAITAAINALVNGAPAALDTLKELTAALAGYKCNLGELS